MPKSAEKMPEVVKKLGNKFERQELFFVRNIELSEEDQQDTKSKKQV